MFGFFASFLMVLWTPDPALEQWSLSFLERIQLFGFQDRSGTGAVLPTKGDVLFIFSDGHFTPRFAKPAGDHKLRSEFFWLGSFAVRPGDGALAFIGRHRSLHERKPTLFLLKSDGDLEILVTGTPGVNGKRCTSTV